MEFLYSTYPKANPIGFCLLVWAVPDNWKVETKNDNSNQILIKDQWIYSLVEVVIKGPKVDIVEKIKKAKSKDKKVVRVVEEMKNTGIKELKGEE